MINNDIGRIEDMPQEQSRPRSLTQTTLLTKKHMKGFSFMSANNKFKLNLFNWLYFTVFYLSVLFGARYLLLVSIIVLVSITIIVLDFFIFILKYLFLNSNRLFYVLNNIAFERFNLPPSVHEITLFMNSYGPGLW